MKMHNGADDELVGVDEELGLVHGVTGTAANVHDLTEADKLLHGEEARVRTDAGYRGIEKRPAHRGRDREWLVLMMPGRLKQLNPRSVAGRAEKRQGPAFAPR